MPKQSGESRFKFPNQTPEQKSAIHETRVESVIENILTTFDSSAQDVRLGRLKTAYERFAEKELEDMLLNSKGDREQDRPAIIALALTLRDKRDAKVDVEADNVFDRYLAENRDVDTAREIEEDAAWDIAKEKGRAEVRAYLLNTENEMRDAERFMYATRWNEIRGRK